MNDLILYTTEDEELDPAATVKESLIAQTEFRRKRVAKDFSVTAPPVAQNLFPPGNLSGIPTSCQSPIH